MAAKKATTKAKEETTTVVEEISVENTPVKEITKKINQAPTWEYRDRMYLLKGNKKPLVFTLPTKHKPRKPLLWFDPEKGYQRELRYATNQKSPFVDEQRGMVTLGRIVFKNGVLMVPKEDVALQQLLSLYHPVKDQLYEEYNPVERSINELEWIDLEFNALSLAKQLDIDQLEAILRVENGNKVDSLSSSELKRDALLFAKRNPGLFINLAQDENVELRNVGVKAVQAGIIRLSHDQRTFYYGDSDRKLMTVPFDEHPYSALAAFFKTDEGMEVYKHLIKRL